MKLQSFFENLSYGELANSSLGNNGEGTIREDIIGRVINLTNRSLMDLYTRFILSEKVLTLQSFDWKSTYHLSRKHAVSNTESTELKYILDTPEKPFLDDVINITLVTNEIGNELPLNDAEQYASVFTPRSDTIQLTHPGFKQVFFVTYQASPKPLEWDFTDPDGSLQQEIDIPKNLEEALAKKTASMVFAAMAGQDSSNKIMLLEQQYEQECQNAEDKGLCSSANLSTNVKLMRRGFV